MSAVAMAQLNALLNASVPVTASFPPGSRYAGLATGRFVEADGREVVYLRRRFVPGPGGFAMVKTHRVGPRDRPDLIAATYLGDPLQFWQLCDANGVMRPEDLTRRPGSLVAINLARGIQPAGFGLGT